MADSSPILECDLPGLTPIKRGKVREIYDLGDGRLLLVATDRISAFDTILPNGIPRRGEVLTQISHFWFDQTEHLIRNHRLRGDEATLPPLLEKEASWLRPRSMVVRKTEPLPIECVVRGFLAGSGWKEYRQHGTVCGIRLPPGLQLASELPEPIFTPATKATSGHDENISFEATEARIGIEPAQKVRKLSLDLYRFGRDYARQRGILLADTKFELGLLNGELILIDELLTPDSSRFWPSDDYKPGHNQPSFDKKIVRDYLERLGWDGTPPAPPLPTDVVAQTQSRYLEIFERLTGKPLPESR